MRFFEQQRPEAQTYIHAAFKLTDQEVIEFYGRNAANTIPGAPALDLRHAVDGQRRLTIHEPLPTTSAGKRFELRNRLIGIYDKGSSGSSFDTEQQIVDAETGKVYATTRTMNFVPGQGNWGGPRGESLRALSKPGEIYGLTGRARRSQIPELPHSAQNSGRGLQRADH